MHASYDMGLGNLCLVLMQDALVAPGGIGQTGLGGKTLVPPVDIPAGTFAWFADPEGNTVGLWKSKS